MLFSEFSKFLQSVEKVGSRNEVTILLADFLAKLNLEDIKPAMYLMQGRLVPKFVDLEFNFSEKLILRALEDSFSVDTKTLYSTLGDVGLIAENLVSGSENSDSLSIVYSQLEEIAKASGKGSQEQKISLYKNLVKDLDKTSAKYVTRIIVGNLRIGFSDKTILDAFSWFLVGNKSLRKTIDVAFGARADLGELAEIIIENKENQNIENILSNVKIRVGIPVASKLVEREKNSKSVWDRMPNCFVQPKLDGLRGQIHYLRNVNSDDVSIELQSEDGELAEIYSRNMESLTDQFPELTSAVRKLGVDSIILDSEIIGFDASNQKFFSYQETMTRRRKYDIEMFSSTFPVKAMCFDILFLNGEDLTQRPIEERLKLLKEILGQKDSSLEMLQTNQVASEEELEEFFEEKVSKGLEGIIAKEVNSTYEPGTRNFKWIKLKANTRSDLVDTLDVVVLGYYSGGGDRARFGFGALLAGVYSPEEDKYYSIGKVGSGFKEEDMPTIFKDMEELKLDSKPENVVVDKNLTPTVWITPKIIMEIIADEITRSPNHTAAKGIETNVKRDDSKKGLSIRFPRIKIWNRQDKDYPNTVSEIVRMYELRKGS